MKSKHKNVKESKALQEELEKELKIPDPKKDTAEVIKANGKIYIRPDRKDK